MKALVSKCLMSAVAVTCCLLLQSWTFPGNDRSSLFVQYLAQSTFAEHPLSANDQRMINSFLNPQNKREKKLGYISIDYEMIQSGGPYSDYRDVDMFISATDGVSSEYDELFVDGSGQFILGAIHADVNIVCPIQTQWVSQGFIVLSIQKYNAATSSYESIAHIRKKRTELNTPDVGTPAISWSGTLYGAMPDRFYITLSSED